MFCSSSTGLSAQSSKCSFIGYANDKKGFLCYDPKAKRIHVSCNVVFFENQYFFHHHLDPDPSLMFSPVPAFDPPDPTLENIKSIIVHERHRRENTIAPAPLVLSTSPALDPSPAPDISQPVHLRR